MSRLHMIFWAFGVCLLAGSVAGANRLIHTDGSTQPGAAGGKPAAAPAGGVVVLGTVDSDPVPIPVGPPAVAGLSTVAKVFVRDGQEIKPGDPLVQFDDRLLRTKLDQARAELGIAEQDVAKAEVGRKLLVITTDRQKAAAAAAEADMTEAQNTYRIARDLYDKVLDAEKDFNTTAKLTEPQKEQRRRENLELRKVAFLVTQAKAKLDDERKKLEALALTPV
ncbi:MAG: biotin/lipoyl-binding protein, partial [Fimbriiglobus sp.]